MTNGDPATTLLGRTWAELEQDAASLIAQTEARVARWEWAKGEASWERPEPLFAERRGTPPVKKPSRPSPGFMVRYGFTDVGDLVIARRVTRDTLDDLDPGSDDVWVEALDGLPVRLHYHYHGLRGSRRRELLVLSRPEYDGDRLLEVVAWGFPARGGSRSREWYERDAGGRVVRIHEDAWRDAAWLPLWTYDVTYDDRGEAATIVATKLGADGTPVREPIVSYRRGTPKAVRDAHRRVEAELVARVEQWVRRVAPGEPVYALALLYSFDGPSMPPALALGFEHERRRTGGSSRDRIDEIWNPAEWSLLDTEPRELLEHGLGECMQLLEQEWQLTNDDRQPRAMLIKAAKALNSVPWQRALKLAPAFAVYATDDELTDLDRNLRATVAARVRAEIERAG